ncbi:MAG: kelch repeat-containing protein [Marinoscillum sp.]|jgi:N-acetylneuraminic acid mutarotase
MKIRLLYIFQMLILAIASCEEVEEIEYGNWVKYSDFEGVTRSSAISFVIDEYAYVGLGTDGDDYLTDFWRYDADNNFWQKMAEFPGEGRVSAVAFSAAGKGYVSTGFNDDLDTEELNDLWEYDPGTNNWTQKSDFPGGGRYAGVAFALNGRGFIGTGYNGNYLKDFWSYNPDSDDWTQIVSLYGSKRQSATAFVIDNRAYVLSGSNNGVSLYDFWAYDAESNAWVDLTLYDEDDSYEEFILAISRYDASSFVLDGYGYIGLGISSSYNSDFYRYDPSDNSWEGDIQAFEGTSRADAVAFVLDDIPYVATGKNSSQKFDDIWGFKPDEAYDEYD